MPTPSARSASPAAQALWAAKALGRVGDRDDDLPLFASSAYLPLKGEVGRRSRPGGGLF